MCWRIYVAARLVNDGTLMYSLKRLPVVMKPRYRWLATERFRQFLSVCYIFMSNVAAAAAMLLLVAAVYGGGQWPHLSAYERGELASNGNYYEPDKIAVRHGICGDPEQVRCID